MTEDEAKTKWCPFARMSIALHDDRFSPAVNRLATESKPKETKIPHAAYCIGSECMAWRVSLSVNDQEFTHITRNAQLVAMDKPERPEPEGGFVDHGYCGLAGQP